MTANPLSDAQSRERILRDLDTNFLVEAAAGTGKTTSLVGRIAALLREGKAEAGQIAAVTFTRKAAAQLRERLATQLEIEIDRQPPGARHDRLERALRELDRAFLGTIHSFCSRLLRERPVEARIDPEFREAEEEENALLEDEIWRRHLDRLHYEGDPLLGLLQEMGVDVNQLKQTYERLARYPEVVPVHEPTERPDLSPAVSQTERLLDEIIPVLQGYGRDHTPDDFSAAVWRAYYYRRNADLSRPAEAAEFLTILRASEVVQKSWPDPAQAKKVQARRKQVQEEWIRPALEAWSAYRHDAAMKLVIPAAEEFRQTRLTVGRPDFTDLLMLSRDMLRDNPRVREYFRRRYCRILVDEFQDTDPIQAEVMLYLTGEDPEARQWMALKPSPGSLFVVGDPKQSIYRFRRADIETYRRVRRLIEESGGEVLKLSRTFRSAPKVCEWVNGVFATVFDGSVPHQAEHASLEPARSASATIHGVFRLVSTIESKIHEAICREDARMIAGWIAAALAQPLEISVREGEGESNRPVRPGDFLVILRNTRYLDLYARALEEAGVASEVTGGKAFGESEEVLAFLSALQAINDPDNPVPLAAYLRGPYCGVDDDALYRFHRQGGRFSFLHPPPTGSDPRIIRAYSQLRLGRKLARKLPPSAAIARAAEKLAVLPGAIIEETGDRRAGNLAKMLGIARRFSGLGLTFAGIVEELEELVREGETGEMSIEPARTDAVRIMNLHKAKGLEAPFVFLAGPHDRSGAKKRHASLDRDTDPPLGHFLVFHQAENGFSLREIARPAGWSELSRVEEDYEKAEDARLLYVASTRAMNMLIVSGRRREDADEDKISFGVWKDLVRLPLEDLPDLPAIRASSKKRRPPDLLSEFSGARADLRRRRAEMRRPSYAAASPSQFEEGFFVAREATGKGMSWGRILHRLLETLMRDGGSWSAVEQFARNLLREEERSLEELSELQAAVQGVLASDLWERARRAKERFVEIPFAVVVPSGEYEELKGSSDKTLINGTIDLVFKEEGVWKLVDYKSGAIPSPSDNLWKEYQTQLRVYRDQWKKLREEPTEAWLCFVERPGELVPLDP